MELLCSNIYHCKPCFSRIYLLIGKMHAAYYYVIKMDRLESMNENVDSFTCIVNCIVNYDFSSVEFFVEQYSCVSVIHREYLFILFSLHRCALIRLQ
jgi:hypothetical protein